MKCSWCDRRAVRPDSMCKECREIDDFARAEVERGLFDLDIIEDPDMDGGLLG